MSIKPWLLALAFLVVQGCDFGSAPGTGTGGDGLTLSGKLQDPQGHALARVKVRVYPDPVALLKGQRAQFARADSTTTQKDGSFRFKSLQEGRYNLEASFTRNDTVFSVLLPGIDFVKDLDLGNATLQASGGLRLKVVDGTGAPVAGAQCAIPGTSWKVFSDGNGECVLTGIAPGTYTVSVSQGGLVLGVSTPVSVEGGEQAEAGKVNLLPSTSGGIGAGWRLESLQGYAYYLPPEMKLLSEGYGLDTWSASYSDGSVSWGLFTGMVGGTPLPDGFPEQTLDGWALDSSGASVTSAILVTYRIPDSLKYEHLGATYIAQLFFVVSSPAMVLADPTPIAFAHCGNPQELARIKTILRSFYRWKGPGPAPVPPPFAPVILTPQAAATGISASPTFTWRPHRGVTLTHYRLQVATDSLFASKVVDDSVSVTDAFAETLSKTAGSLAQGARYYWRVVAVGPGGSTPSSVRSFTTAVAVPSQPAMLYPPAGYPHGSLSVRLTWGIPAGADAYSYRIEISKESFFTSLVLRDSVSNPTIIGGEYSHLVGPLEPGALYYWRVIAVTTDGSNQSSSGALTRVFTTPAATMDSLPIVPALSNSPVQYAGTYNFKWTSANRGSGTRYYHLQVAEDSLFLDPVVNDSVAPDTSLTTKAVNSLLKTDVTHYWRVAGVGPSGFTFSEVRTFKPYIWLGKRNAQ